MSLSLLSHTISRTVRLASSALILLLTFSGSITAAIAVPTDSKPTPYKIVNGKVDQSTYTGWRVYHSICYACHGTDATGTDMAPSLVEKVGKMTYYEFNVNVLSRYRIVLPIIEAPNDNKRLWRHAIEEEAKRIERGEHGQLKMPAWEDNPEVKPHIRDLYAYLRARADGALGPGKPEVITP